MLDVGALSRPAIKALIDGSANVNAYNLRRKVAECIGDGRLGFALSGAVGHGLAWAAGKSGPEDALWDVVNLVGTGIVNRGLKPLFNRLKQVPGAVKDAVQNGVDSAANWVSDRIRQITDHRGVLALVLRQLTKVRARAGPLTWRA